MSQDKGRGLWNGCWWWTLISRHNKKKDSQFLLFLQSFVRYKYYLYNVFHVHESFEHVWHVFWGTSLVSTMWWWNWCVKMSWTRGCITIEGVMTSIILHLNDRKHVLDVTITSLRYKNALLHLMTSSIPRTRRRHKRHLINMMN